MFPKADKTINELKSSNSLENSLSGDEQSDDAIKVSYPLSFLLLESEEDSFVKGYN